MNQTSIAMIGESAELHNTLNAANIIAATPASVLILGESGTGKELIAQLLHQQSDRRHNPMISINCGALSETLVESELFGHKKGAFTGADQSRAGKLKSAHKSTLFLDEIGELPLSIQAKLLRFLETGECQTVGEESVTKLDVRIIAATNKDLYQCVAEGTFRQDLYFRLNVIPLTLPPLRERHNDIPLLINHYAKYFSDKYQLPNITFSKSAFKILSHYSWPGNVRELKNFTERMAILNSGKMIEAENLPNEFFSQSVQNANSTFTLPDNGIDLESLEINFINQALIKTAGNRSRAARLLGLSRDTLLYRLKKYSLC